MKKRLLSVLIFVSMLLPLFSLSGCHGSKSLSAFTMPDGLTEGKEFNLVFWAKNDTNVYQTRAYQHAVEGFEALYPNIHITIKQYTDYSRIYQDVITNIPTQTTPNICITYPDHIATYKTGSNVIVPLDSLASDPEYGFGGSELKFEGPGQDGIVAQYLEECTLDGELYALPFIRSSEALYVNKTYVEKLGYTVPEVMTWDLIFEISEKAMEKNEDGTYKVNGQSVMIPFIYKSTDNMMIQMQKQLGIEVSDENGKINLFSDETADILTTISSHVETRAFSTFAVDSYPGNYFDAGQCIFAVDSTAGATWMGADAPLHDITEDEMVEFETVVLPVPQYDTENIQMISQGPSICIFNKEDPEEVLATWLFAQYLLSDEVQLEYAETEGYVPVTESARNSAEYADYLSRRGEDTGLNPNGTVSSTYYSVKIDATLLVLNNIDKTFTTPVWNGSASLRKVAGNLIEDVVRATRGGTEITEEYIESLYKKQISQYSLNVNGISEGEQSSGKIELGEMPKASVILLVSLLAVWVLIGVYAFFKILLPKLKSR